MNAQQEGLVTKRPADAQYIRDETGLIALCERLRERDRLAVDTEFMGEDSFHPRLEIIQVATGDAIAIIDYQSVSNLAPFFALLDDARILKVFHAGRQDLEIFSVLSGSVPTPVFDTQVAAAMVGYGTQIGYAQLVRQVLRVALEKSETFTNWAQRPLTPEQIAYALEDVRYLLALHDHLVRRLKALGRLEWAEEEFRRLQSLADHEARDPRLRYQRIKGWEGLGPRVRGVLREVAAWREHEAKRRDRPRGRILRDEILVEIARRAPTTIEALGQMRGIHPSHVEKYGEALVAAVKQGLAVHDHELPPVEKRKRIDPETAGLADLLGTALKVRAVEASISPQLLATSADLELFALERGRGAAEKLPILQGWRRQMAGEHLLKVLEGRLTVGYDPETKQVRLFER
ncbi:MAG: ribonuclease D [Nitrospirae bacterium]|nr:MAG: ribonuclease D [Nitrospirota bacterium]